MKYCPGCGRLLTADTEVYTRHRKSVHETVEIIGCDSCINTQYADRFFDEEEREELERALDDYDNYLWDMGQEMRKLMSFGEGGI